MKRTFLPIVSLGLLLLVPCGLLGALEIELTGGLNSLSFNPYKETAYGEGADSMQFEGYSYISGDLLLKSSIYDKIGFKIHASRDNILQNSLSCELTLNADYLYIEFGAFAGMKDSLEIPDMGITGGIDFFYPGIAFLSFYGSSSLGSRYEFMSDNYRETLEVKLGFWLPNVIPSLSASIKSYSYAKESEDSAIRNELIRLQLGADIFAKNFPFTVRVDAGYEIFTRFYESSGITDEFSAIFAGFEFNWQALKPLRVIAGLEMPVYFIEKEPLKVTDSFWLLYKFYGGVAFTFF